MVYQTRELSGRRARDREREKGKVEEKRGVIGAVWAQIYPLKEIN